MSALVVLLLALVLWAVTRGSGGGGAGDGKNASASTTSHTPAGTITPGPASSGPHISAAPGGRDTAPPDDEGTATAGDGGTDAGATGDTAGSGGDSGDGSGGGSSSGGTGGGSGGAASAGSGPAGDLVPAGSTLPDCSASNVSLSLSSEARDYPVGGPAALQLHATNNGGVTCKLDFGPTSAVFTVTATPGNDHVWASDDCPRTTSPYLLKVPAHGSTVYTLRWDGKTSSPKCASPKGSPAAAGNYLVEAKLPGYQTEQATFTLSQD